MISVNNPNTGVDSRSGFVLYTGPTWKGGLATPGASDNIYLGSKVDNTGAIGFNTTTGGTTTTKMLIDNDGNVGIGRLPLTARYKSQVIFSWMQ